MIHHIDFDASYFSEPSTIPNSVRHSLRDYLERIIRIRLEDPIWDVCSKILSSNLIHSLRKYIWFTQYESDTTIVDLGELI